MRSEINIKGMICSRCLRVLSSELNVAKAHVVTIELGKIIVEHDPVQLSLQNIQEIIEASDFEVIWNDSNILAEKTKKWVISFVWNHHHSQPDVLSEYLTKNLYKSYDHISKNFKSIFGFTIERYYIILKVERSKELIEYGQLTFAEIAFELGYQNASALSRIFKRETGMTASEYSKLEVSQRIPIDKI